MGINCLANVIFWKGMDFEREFWNLDIFLWFLREVFLYSDEVGEFVEWGVVALAHMCFEVEKSVDYVLLLNL